MEEKPNPLIIGIAGNATVGKDLFADLLRKELGDKYHFLVRKTPFAYALKNDLEKFVKDKCGLDIWHLNAEQKSNLRPLMVWYGTEFMRNKYKGQYWINKLKTQINGFCNQADLFIYTNPIFLVPDVRFKQYEYDELDYIKENGVLVFIEKYNILPNDPPSIRLRKQYTMPANIHEEKNNSILSENADYKLEWVGCDGDIDKINKTCLPEVQKFITWANDKGVLKLNG